MLGGLYELIALQLTEKQRHLLAGAAARALGRGGGARMARISGLSRPTVYAGVRGLDVPPDPRGRIRRPGGGPGGWSNGTLARRKHGTSWSIRTPAGIRKSPAVDVQVDPPAPRRACRARVPGLPRHRRPAAQAPTLHAAAHPQDRGGRPAPWPRDAQFRYVNEQAKAHLAAGQPVLSADTKKRLVGRYANGGAEWQPAGEPERVRAHDFPDEELGKAIPYGSTTSAPTPAR